MRTFYPGSWSPSSAARPQVKPRCGKSAKQKCADTRRDYFMTQMLKREGGGGSQTPAMRRLSSTVAVIFHFPYDGEDESGRTGSANELTVLYKVMQRPAFWI